MHNYEVGRNKARLVLIEGMRAGYVYAHHSRDALPITYHFSTCRPTLREFVVGNGWETEESYALKNQALGEEEGPGTEKQGHVRVTRRSPHREAAKIRTVPTQCLYARGAFDRDAA